LQVGGSSPPQLAIATSVPVNKTNPLIQTSLRATIRDRAWGAAALRIDRSPLIEDCQAL
jgi:hypothetical protein